MRFGVLTLFAGYRFRYLCLNSSALYVSWVSFSIPKNGLASIYIRHNPIIPIIPIILIILIVPIRPSRR